MRDLKNKKKKERDKNSKKANRFTILLTILATPTPLPV